MDVGDAEFRAEGHEARSIISESPQQLGSPKRAETSLRCLLGAYWKLEPVQTTAHRPFYRIEKIGTPGRTRTSTSLRTTDFESPNRIIPFMPEGPINPR